MEESQIPEEIKKKLEQIKKKLESFKKKVLEKYKEEIIGVALLPPEKEKKNDINVLVLINTLDEKDNPFELRDKVIKESDKIAKEIDKNIKPQIILLPELKEACLDGKYELLQLIAMSAAIHDPKEILGALKIAEVHKSMVIKKFERYVVSYIAVGSLFRGDTISHDIDVAVIIDDTDVKRMSRFELREKLGAIIRSMGAEAGMITGVKKALHVQVYILTDFWDFIKDASPVIFTFLRDGVPLYDRGVFMPWRLLLQMGKIKPSPEAIDMHMDLGEKLLERAHGKLLSILGEDIYYALLNPAQAALMLYGIPPPTHKETIRLLEEIFVKKEKLLEKKYVDILDNAFKQFKEIEHGKIKEVSGKEIDDFLEEADDYLKRIKKLFNQIDKRMEGKRVFEFHDACMKVVDDVLKADGVEEIIDSEKEFKKLVDQGKFPKKFLDQLKEIKKIKREYKSLSKQEIEKVRKQSGEFIKSLIDYIQMKRGLELNKAKIRFKYGDKFGEVFLLGNVAFIIEDIDAKKKEISRAKILPNGGLGEIKKSELKELEDSIMNFKLEKHVFIKEKIFEDLKKLFGKDIEILVSY